MIGKAIRKMRLTRNLTQRQLGKKINLSHNAISDYEIEKNRASVEVLLSIMKVCDYKLAFDDGKNSWTLDDIVRDDI